MEPDRTGLHKRVVDAYATRCPSGWPTGPNEGYFLQNLANHLIGAGRGDDLADLLLHLEWLQAKVNAGLMFDPPQDYADARVVAGNGPRPRLLPLLERAVRRDASVVAADPALLLQCLWHTCYWHDAPEAGQHYQWKKPQDASDPALPWNQPGEKLCDLLRGWVDAWRRGTPASPWLRSRRPSGARLDSGLLATLRGHEGAVRCVAVTPDGRWLVSGSDDNTARVWETDSGREVAVLRGYLHGAPCVAVTPDGRRVVTASGDVVGVWDMDSSREIARLGERDATEKTEAAPPEFAFWGPRYRVQSLEVTPDGRRVVAGSSDSVGRVWDTESGRGIAALQGHKYGVPSVAVTSDGRWVVSGSNDMTVRVWDTDSGREVAVFRGHQEWVKRVRITPDGREATSTDATGRSIRWDATTGKQVDVADHEAHPQNKLPHNLRWPGGNVTHCESGVYALVVEGNFVIPSKVERPIG